MVRAAVFHAPPRRQPKNANFSKKKTGMKLILTWYLNQTITWYWKEYHESRRCSRNTYPESNITKNTGIRRLKQVNEQVMSIMAGAAVFHDPLSLAQAAGLAISMTAIYGC